jgi:hypothetical protein
MPSLQEIAQFWHDRNAALDVPGPWLLSVYIGLGEPFCFKCQWLAPVTDGPGVWDKATSFLDRAHLITRSLKPNLTSDLGRSAKRSPGSRRQTDVPPVGRWLQTRRSRTERVPFGWH